ncbi:hypothetical protein F5146DRAFT_1143976 [Armillaria mellea]|nr:hypothetical protein F5146DRAFT_1143976 [Armillaria mellea]
MAARRFETKRTKQAPQTLSNVKLQDAGVASFVNKRRWARGKSWEIRDYNWPFHISRPHIRFSFWYLERVTASNGAPTLNYKIVNAHSALNDQLQGFNPSHNAVHVPSLKIKGFVITIDVNTATRISSPLVSEVHRTLFPTFMARLALQDFLQSGEEQIYSCQYLCDYILHSPSICYALDIPTNAACPTTDDSIQELDINDDSSLILGYDQYFLPLLELLKDDQVPINVMELTGLDWLTLQIAHHSAPHSHHFPISAS